ncbi:MAG: hypothetical protein HY823_07485 [Acidobacteria bacterium]|nr:hypothetical protein [Acidobacteriota bacterium]
MAATPKKDKPKAKRQTPEERAEGLRYIHMMYGPTAGEARPVARKTNLGAPYLSHPKFLALMTAFRKGEAFQFSVTDKGRSLSVATDGSQILFDGKVLYYSRPWNRHEEHLLLNHLTAVQNQGTEALIHLAAAVLRSLPELEAPQLICVNHKLYLGGENLESAAAEQGPNLLMGAYRHQKAPERMVR